MKGKRDGVNNEGFMIYEEETCVIDELVQEHELFCGYRFSLQFKFFKENA